MITLGIAISLGRFVNNNLYGIPHEGGGLACVLYKIL